MQIDSPDDRREERQEDRVVARIVAGREEVLAAIGNRPVAVLARTVDTVERLLVQQTDQSVRLRRLTQHLHDHHVVIDREIDVLEHRRQFELRRRDLVVTRLRGNAELPQTKLHLVHELEDTRTDCTKIMVVELLMLRRRRTEDRATRLQQVGTLQVEAAVDEEVLLLGAQRDRHVRLRLLELLHQTLGRARDRLDRTKQRRLHVERRSRIRTERRRDAQRRAVLMPLDERRRSRIPRRVTTGLEGRTESAGREGRRVGLTADQVLAGKLLHRRRHARRLEKRVVLLGRAAGHRLEPMGEMSRALFERPSLHPLRDSIGNRRIKRLALLHRRNQLRSNGLAQILANRLFTKDVRTVVLQARIGHNAGILSQTL